MWVIGPNASSQEEQHMFLLVLKYLPSYHKIKLKCKDVKETIIFAVPF